MIPCIFPMVQQIFHNLQVSFQKVPMTVALIVHFSTQTACTVALGIYRMSVRNALQKNDVDFFCRFANKLDSDTGPITA